MTKGARKWVQCPKCKTKKTTHAKKKNDTPCNNSECVNSKGKRYRYTVGTHMTTSPNARKKVEQPTEQLKQEPNQSPPEAEPKEKIDTERRIMSFADLMGGFGEKKPVPKVDEETEEEHQTITEAVKEEIQGVIPEAYHLGGYMKALISCAMDMIEGETPTKKHKRQLFAETINICSVYLRIELPEEDGLEPFKVKPWYVLIPTGVIMLWPIIQKFLKKKKDKKEDETDGK